MTVLSHNFISVKFHFDVNLFILALQLLKSVVIVMILYSLTYKK